MRRVSAQNGLLLPVIATGIALIALLWFLAIGPKMGERSKAAKAVASQEQRLKTAQQKVTAYTASHKQFAGMEVELRRLNVAVPARGDISGLLRQVQRRARLRSSDLRLATLKATSAPATATQQPATPGATAGPGGMSTLPFTFTYTGRYFDLLKVLRAARDAVNVRSGNLSIDGRLLTIDGVAFKRPTPDSKLTKVTLNATAYIAADPTTPPAAADAAVKPAATTVEPAPPPTKAGP